MASLLTTPTEILRTYALLLSHFSTPIFNGHGQTPRALQSLNSCEALSTGPSSPVMSTMWSLMVTVSMEAYTTPESKIPVTNVVLDRLVECIERINVPYAREWIQELRAGSMDAFTTLLISQLLNLKRLFLDKNFNRESRLRGMMLRSALCEKSTGSHLSSFTYLKDVSSVPAFPTTFAKRRAPGTHRTSSLSFTCHQLSG
ncbi:hypothetical protein PENARI_c023G08688 [Penicillium arizonense]|uniref:Uncharacterized protein n=1 Tax=Penicillium arizonense TaxID=1835702 RepID=A0A1F5L786_PENAI|nr:hypothetical protein PENARI_c023G08688 [Penicillium arizonense]OGE49098.1 hypothetical protein PENARI_c023G08688 [Penicillium arizonense]